MSVPRRLQERYFHIKKGVEDIYKENEIKALEEELNRTNEEIKILQSHEKLRKQPFYASTPGMSPVPNEQGKPRTWQTSVSNLSLGSGSDFPHNIDTSESNFDSFLAADESNASAMNDEPDENPAEQVASSSMIDQSSLLDKEETVLQQRSGMLSNMLSYLNDLDDSIVGGVGKILGFPDENEEPGQQAAINPSLQTMPSSTPGQHSGAGGAPPPLSAAAMEPTMDMDEGRGGVPEGKQEESEDEMDSYEGEDPDVKFHNRKKDEIYNEDVHVAKNLEEQIKADDRAYEERKKEQLFAKPRPRPTLKQKEQQGKGGGEERVQGVRFPNGEYEDVGGDIGGDPQNPLLKYARIQNPGLENIAEDPQGLSYRYTKLYKNQAMDQLAKKSHPSMGEKVNVGMGETKGNWRFNGPYDYPTETDNPKFFSLAGAYAKAGPKAFEKGLRHISMWKQGVNKKGLMNQRSPYWKYHHEKRKWSRMSRANRDKYITKLTKMQHKGHVKQVMGEMPHINLKKLQKSGFDWRLLAHAKTMENEEKHKLRRKESIKKTFQ